MAIEIKVPQLPESVADATLVTWHKQAGQAVSRDENLADLETDKVVLEVPAPVNGVLKELKIVAGTIGDQRPGARGARRRCRCRGARAAAAPKPAAAAAAPRRLPRRPPLPAATSSRPRCAAWSKRSSSIRRRSRRPDAMAA